MDFDSGSLAPSDQLASTRRAIFPGESEAYAAARQALLAEEIDLRRHLAQVAEHRRALPPGPIIEKAYRFADANGSEVDLVGLFGEHETLVTYFWMYGPQRARPCPMCTNLLGPLDAERLPPVVIALCNAHARFPELARPVPWRLSPPPLCAAL